MAGSAAVVSTAVIYGALSLLMLFGIVLLTTLMFSGRLTAASTVRAPVWVTGLVWILAGWLAFRTQ